jgi:hypothetical protein
VADEVRRLRLYYFSTDTLIDLMNGRIEVVEPPMPADARVVNVGYESSRHALVAIVESEEFEPVPPYAHIPEGGPFRLHAHPTPDLDRSRSGDPKRVLVG